MREVLISIQPKWCELIASGKKTVEVRKTRPKIETPFKCYIYQTKKPVSVSFSGTGKHISEYDKTCYYNERSGKVMGEFVCDRIQNYECEFVDDDCYEEIASIFVDEDGDETGFIEWSNDGDLPYESIDLYRESCIEYNELKKYIGVGFGTFYGWHISDLVIYEQPKELCEFFKIGHSDYCYLEWKKRERLRKELAKHNEMTGDNAHLNTDSDFAKNLKILSPFKIKSPPQSWCYVERSDAE